MGRDEICLFVSPANWSRLEAIIKDRNSARRTVGRAEIVLATAGGAGAGEIMRRTQPQHRAREFIRFLKKIGHAVQKHLDLHLIMDNYSTHKTDEVQAWCATLADLKGGDPQTNAAKIRALLQGETGPYRDIVLLNTAAALIVAGKADGLDMGVAQAAASIDSGAANIALDKLIAVTNEVA